MAEGQIQERILKEIKEGKGDKDMKMFLERILEFELDILDQGRPTYKPDYERMLNEIFFK